MRDLSNNFCVWDGLMNDQRCEVCHRDPNRVRKAWQECSHVDCPFRPTAWSDDIPVDSESYYIDKDDGEFKDDRSV